MRGMNISSFSVGNIGNAPLCKNEDDLLASKYNYTLNLTRFYHDIPDTGCLSG